MTRGLVGHLQEWPKCLNFAFCTSEPQLMAGEGMGGAALAPSPSAWTDLKAVSWRLRGAHLQVEALRGNTGGTEAAPQHVATRLRVGPSRLLRASAMCQWGVW